MRTNSCLNKKKTGLRVWFFLFMMFANVSAFADVSWTGVTQSPGDYTSSGVVTITGAVTLNPGTYTFDSLVIATGKTLTVLSDTTAGTGITIYANTVTVAGTGKIDGEGKGYSGTQGPGKGNKDNSSCGGGCHGGLGGIDNTYDFCVPYGDPLAPVTLGSPGAMATSSGPGGGAIKFEVSGTMTVTGTISMNGLDSTAAGTKGGAGAGGSIWIKAAILTGGGTIRANGANTANSKGSGSGGRVLVSYGTSTFTGTATANGGTGSGYINGGFGSVLWLDYINNDLFVKKNSTIANGTYNFRNVNIASSVYLSNDKLGYRSGLGTGKGNATGTYGSGAGYGGRGSYAGVAGGGTYGSMLEPVDQGSGGGSGSGEGFGGIGGGAIKLVLTGTLTVDGYLTSSGGGAWYNYDYGYPGGGSGGSIWIIADSIAGSGAIGAVGGYGSTDSGGTAYGGVGGGGRVAVYYSTSFASTVGFDVSVGAGGYNDGATVGSVVVVNTTTNDLYFPTSSTIQNATYTYNSVTLAQNAIVTAIDGNAQNTGTGKGTTVSSNGGGGGYGGAGGNGTNGVGGAAYGSSTSPTDLGSGGGGCGTTGIGGTSGGAIKFVLTNDLTINTGAVLSASGANKINNYCGGGSGGSIWITAKNINSITNGIVANGGNGDTKGGGGGGGRIAIYCTGTYAGTLSAAGGTGKNAGAVGSTYVKCSSSTPWLFRGY